jgi:hypothetical protein
MSLKPVVADADAHLDGDGQWHGVGHGIENDGLHLLLLGFVAIEDLFVVYL